jgi:pterin-4a-carbinolamine dehydratase
VGDLIVKILQADDVGMAARLFISYRRTDSHQAALGLYAQLRARIGSGSVFLDRSGISAGDIWPERLREAINEATLVLALVGPKWLGAADEYGRRRLDLPADWVRNELSAGMDSDKPVIPVLLDPLNKMPPAEALPTELAALSSYQTFTLRDDHWDDDLNSLVQLLVENYGFQKADPKVINPPPVIRLPPLTQIELDEALTTLPRWEPVESLIPGEYPKSRYEIRKVYTFESFESAIEFMNLAIRPIDKLKHHPRWENQWRTVTVYLTTWDIGFRVSRLDIDLAKAFDRIYDKLQKQRAVSARRPKA